MILSNEFNDDPKQSRNRFVESAIEEGVDEYRHPELFEGFEVLNAQEPLTKKEFNGLINEFYKEHILDIAQATVEDSTKYEEVREQTNQIIDKFKITGSDLAKMGSNYVIQESDGKKIIYEMDNVLFDGSRELSVSEVVALAFVKEHVNLDTSSSESSVSHRYYLYGQDRYLAGNDFGMKTWDADKDKLVNGDVTNLSTFIGTVRNRIEEIESNLYAVIAQTQKTYGGENSEVVLDSEDTQTWDRAKSETIRKISSKPQNLDLIINAVPFRKFRDHQHFHYLNIAKKYSLISSDPESDFLTFDTKKQAIDKIVSRPTQNELDSVDFKFVYSDYYKRPVLIDDRFQEKYFIDDAKEGVRDVLARNYAKSNETLNEKFQSFGCHRGTQSPYYYGDGEIMDFISTVGVEKASSVLDTDDRKVYESMVGWKWLKAMDVDLTTLTPDQIKKQLFEANKLDRAGVWSHLIVDRNTEIGDHRKKHFTKDEIVESCSPKELKRLFGEGKSLYWIAQKVYYSDSTRSKEDRFYKNDYGINWSRYDMSGFNIPFEKVQEHLTKHRGIITTLLNTESDKYPQATLGLIIKALDGGFDLRGLSIARDKQRYLHVLLSENKQDTLEFALSDWPQEWLDNVSKDEISLYYDHANTYLLFDPNGLSKYAEWRSKNRTFDEEFSRPPASKSELDFRICLGRQDEGVLAWYKEGNEYVGGDVMRKYLLRFNATRDLEGKTANWHDVLFWIPNVKNLKQEEAKSVILSIDSVDENREFIDLLPRYNSEKDQFLGTGEIGSLRELRKRVMSIESNIDLSSLPENLLDITSAPGFNLGALDRFNGTERFKNLLEGKLDETQPFKPYTRKFVSRQLSEAISEGLGSASKNIKGTASDVKGFFHELKQLLKKQEGDKKMEVKDLLGEVPVSIEEDIIDLLLKNNVDVGQVVEAELHSKSDPQAWVSGNYTDCCMPFGDSKNTDYMFNPSTQYFTIKYGGRIVAQSVVVDSVDRTKNEPVVVLDNIEIANNYTKLSPLLSKVYQVFWSEYTNKPVKIGTGYSDLVPSGSKLENNTFESKTHLEYSDAKGSHVYNLPKISGINSSEDSTSYANITERDARMITELEKKCYPNEMVLGEEHIRGILTKQRELEVPGSASSFIIRQGKEAAGYLLVLPEESEINSGERVAHIYDMAILPEYRGGMVFWRMVEKLLDSATAYGVSLEAEARASTSYAILMNERVRKMLERKGFVLTHNEKLEKYMGEEDFYLVRFENKNKVQE